MEHDEFELARYLFRSGYTDVVLKCGDFPVIELWDDEMDAIRIIGFAATPAYWWDSDLCIQVSGCAARAEAEWPKKVTIQRQVAYWSEGILSPGEKWVFEDIDE